VLAAVGAIAALTGMSFQDFITSNPYAEPISLLFPRTAIAVCGSPRASFADPHPNTLLADTIPETLAGHGRQASPETLLIGENISTLVVAVMTL
jgi:hypothetical protein